MRKALAALLALALLGGTACDTLLQDAEATDVPGAAATLTRAERTPIPTPLTSPSPVTSAASPSALAQSALPAPVVSPTPRSSAALDADTQETSDALLAALATPDLPGMEELLLDQVSLSSADGGEVLDRDSAAEWLRDHAGPNLTITQTQRSSLSVQLEIVTAGWPTLPPITAGQITFNFHRYAPNGTQDEANGAWKADTLDVE